MKSKAWRIENIQSISENHGRVDAIASAASAQALLSFRLQDELKNPLLYMSEAGYFLRKCANAGIATRYWYLYGRNERGVLMERGLNV